MAYTDIRTIPAFKPAEDRVDLHGDKSFIVGYDENGIGVHDYPGAFLDRSDILVRGISNDARGEIRKAIAQAATPQAGFSSVDIQNALRDSGAFVEDGKGPQIGSIYLQEPTGY